MKRTGLFVSLLLVFSVIFLNSCNDSTTVINGNWKPQADWGGNSVSGTFSFAINDVAYVGLGWEGADALPQYRKNAYSWSAAQNFWKEIAPFPGVGREEPVSFALNGKGYVGGGYNRTLGPGLFQMNDFWEYDPTSDSWTQIADFPYKFYAGTAFTVPEGAFVGGGNDGTNFHNDFYRYDAANDEWVQVASINKKKWKLISLVLAGKAYVIGGDNSNSSISYDFYEFDPASNQWTDRSTLAADANYADFQVAVRRSAGVAFELNGMGYVVGGVIPGTSSPSALCYQYNPSSGTWTKMTNFEGGGRQFATHFVVSNRAFVGMGINVTQRYPDVWEWLPEAAYDAVN